MGDVSFFMIKFTSDRVEVKTGNIDGGAWVKLYVGEYDIQSIMQLALVRDKTIKVTVEEEQTE